MEIVGQVEIDDYCQKILKLRWPDVPKWRDIRDVRGAEVIEKVGRVDLISGGFPCQDISTAGKGAGITGERSGLWKEMLRIIREVRPRYVLVENVTALLGRGLGVVLGDLAESGYDAEWDCIPASAVGAPHQRDRVWIVAYTSNERCNDWCDNREKRYLQNDQERANEKIQSKRNKRKPGFSQACPDVAYTTKPREQEYMGDTVCVGRQGHPRRRPRTIFADGYVRGSQSSWWVVEPNVGRVAYGTSSELDATLRRFTYENSDNQKAVSKIDEFRWQILQRMWGERESPKTSLRPSARYLLYLMSIVPQERAYEEWNMGTWIAKNNGLRNLWERVHAQTFQEAENLFSELLEGIRAAECSQKVGLSRVDRLKLLGNGQVPQVVCWIAERILDYDKKIKERE